MLLFKIYLCLWVYAYVYMHMFACTQRMENVIECSVLLSTNTFEAGSLLLFIFYEYMFSLLVVFCINMKISLSGVFLSFPFYTNLVN